MSNVLKIQGHSVPPPTKFSPMESPHSSLGQSSRVPSLIVPWCQLLGKRSTRGCGFDRCISYKGHSQNVSLKVRFSPKAEGVPVADAVPYNLCTQKPMWDVMFRKHFCAEASNLDPRIHGFMTHPSAVTSPLWWVGGVWMMLTSALKHSTVLVHWDFRCSFRWLRDFLPSLPSLDVYRVWIFRCLYRLELLQYTLSHSLHAYCFATMWTFMCLTKL